MKLCYILYDELYYKYSAIFIKSLNARLESESKVKNYSFNQIVDQKNIFDNLSVDDEVHLVGDDSIISRFINIFGINLNFKIYYNNFGIQSDFISDNDSVQDKKEVLINNFIYNLPKVIVNDKAYYFINGVSCGFDSNCYIKKVEKIKNNPKKKVNYFFIALKELLFKFKPINCTITVDGVKYKYHNTYFASILKGRFNCGGMMLAPSQDRFDIDSKVSVVTLSDCNKVKALDIFMLVFKGKHVGNGKQVHIISGKEINVSFNKNFKLFIDGINLGEVTTYSIRID